MSVHKWNASDSARIPPVRAYVAVTDRDWYRFLRDRPDLDEVNF